MNGVGFQHGARSPDSLGSNDAAEGYEPWADGAEKALIVANSAQGRILADRQANPRLALKISAPAHKARQLISCRALNECLTHIKRLTDSEAIGQLSAEAVGLVFVIGSIIQLHWP